MQVGVFIFATDHTPPIGPLATEIEGRGFDLLLLPEHTHIPVTRTELSPGGPPLAEEHRRSLDPFVALGAAAASTTTLIVGTGICLVAQRDPIILAKAVASLDWMSGGRFLFGVGYGWHPDEVGNHVAEPSRRLQVAREHLLAMREIWANEQASFDGEFVSFPPLWSWPKPVQQPHPPILIGGAPRGSILREVVAIGDGWMPYGYFHDVEAGMSRLRRLCEEAGRDPASIEVAVMGCRPTRSAVEEYERLGASRVVFDLPTEDWDQLRQRLDRYAGLLNRSSP